MNLYERNGNAIYVLKVLKKYTDENHMLKPTEIKEKVIENFNVKIDERTIRRIINLLKFKPELSYDISNWKENKNGYYISKDPETDFEPGEIRAIIDMISYSNYLDKQLSNEIIRKCKNLQNIYENEKLKDYKVYCNDTKTDNKEVIKNIEDIQDAIYNKHKIEFEYWKYELNGSLKKEKVSTPRVIPYTIVYSLQEIYLIALKDGIDELFTYRLDRMKNVKEIKGLTNVYKISEKELNEYIKSNVAMFGGNSQEIVAKCKMHMLDNIIDIFGRKVKLEKINQDYFKVTINANIDGIRYWALRNIREVEILEPQHLRDEIEKILKKEINKYK
jgi:predicted DNA-binding transcriptional regulator YafY